MPETRREKFIRLANKRVNRALNMIRLIGNLSNRTHYEYTDDDIRIILKSLEDEVRSAKRRFERSPDTERAEFYLE